MFGFADFFRGLRRLRGTAGLATALAVASMAPVGAARAADSAVIIQYHRFGEGDYPSTNVTIAQFEAHLEKLKTGGYSVLPVPHIIAALESATPLPERAIGITIDDAYLSVYTEAWPRLNEAGFPFTLFVATDSVDRGARGMMSWDQIRDLAEAGVTIGSHGSTHNPLWQMEETASREDVARSQERIRAELGLTPTLFAYPYGEYDPAVRALVIDAGFEAAFGQHSGVVHAGADFFALPRFALNQTYGGIDRFLLIVETLPLPVSDVTPADPVLGTNPPAFGFTVDDSLEEIDRIACFASHQGRAKVELLGGNRVEVRVAEAFPPGRARINCTLPGPDERWRWFGVQFIVPKP